FPMLQLERTRLARSARSGCGGSGRSPSARRSDRARIRQQSRSVRLANLDAACERRGRSRNFSDAVRVHAGEATLGWRRNVDGKIASQVVVARSQRVRARAGSHIRLLQTGGLLHARSGSEVAAETSRAVEIQRATNAQMSGRNV